jgi:hypothetical protein
MLIETQETAALGAIFTSPDKSQLEKVCSMSFVHYDTKNAGVNDFPPNDNNATTILVAGESYCRCPGRGGVSMTFSDFMN